MDKAELILKVNSNIGLAKKETGNVVDAIITDTLSKEGKVTLVGVGTFQVMKKRGRRGLSPEAKNYSSPGSKEDSEVCARKRLREKLK